MLAPPPPLVGLVQIWTGPEGGNLKPVVHIAYSPADERSRRNTAAASFGDSGSAALSLLTMVLSSSTVSPSGLAAIFKHSANAASRLLAITAPLPSPGRC